MNNEKDDARKLWDGVAIAQDAEERGLLVDH